MSRKRNNSSNGEAYLALYPRLAEWINVCRDCAFRGHKPDLPTTLKGRDNLRSFFPELALDENGCCEQCAAVRQTLAGQ